MSMNMTVLTEERNRGYLIAGIAGIVAFISFFLPYYSVSAGFSSSFSGSFSVNASQVGGLLWLVFILILVSIAVSALLIFRGNTPSSLGLTGTSTANQVRYGAYALIGAGGLGALFLLLRTGGIDYGTSADGISAGPALGFWLLLITMIAVAVGGVLAMRTTAIVPSSQAFPPSQPRPSVQSPQQQWPSQQQSTQYPPSQYPPSQPQQPTSQQQPPW